MEDLRQFMFAPLNENKKWEPSSESEDILFIIMKYITYALYYTDKTFWTFENTREMWLALEIYLHFGE